MRSCHGGFLLVIVAAAEVRVLHQIQLVDRIDLLAGQRCRGAGGHVMTVLLQKMRVLVVMVMVVLLLLLLLLKVLVILMVLVLHGQIQGHGVRSDLVCCRGAAVQGHVRTAEAVHRMVAGVRTCTKKKKKCRVSINRVCIAGDNYSLQFVCIV